MELKTGLALFSLMSELKEDYLGTLEKVSALGCKTVEFVATPKDENGAPVVTAEEIGRKVEELHLEAISSHVMLDASTDLDRVIDENLKMGAKALVLPFAAMFTQEQVLKTAELCNKAAEKCRRQGMKFFYHNHFQEFVKIDGKYALDLLAENTDPDLVQFELDLYWAYRAGIDPTELLKKLGSRCTMLHQKDLSRYAETPNLFFAVKGEHNEENVMGAMRTATKPTDIVPVGSGILPVSEYCKTAEALGYATHILVELDSVCGYTEENHSTPLTPLESVDYSLKTLKMVLNELHSH